MMECSIHPPNSYICTHQRQLLPDWEQSVASVLIVLQHCPISLFDRTLETEACKQQLRQQFLQLAGSIADQVKQQGQAAAVFDPRTGEPIDSAVGGLRLHDVALVRSLLGYETIDCGGCLAIVHPRWQGAVYPATLLSSARPAAVEEAMRHSIATQSFLADGKLFGRSFGWGRQGDRVVFAVPPLLHSGRQLHSIQR